MRHFLAALCLLAATSHVGAAPSSIIGCNEEFDGPPVGTWLPDGAKAGACYQTVIGSPLLIPAHGIHNNLAVAFRNGIASAIKRVLPDGVPADAVAFKDGDWYEHGSIGPVGELWWGRGKRWHVIAGQSTQERLRKEVTLLPVKEQMELSRWATARMMAQMRHAPMPVQAGDAKYTVFGTRKTVTYVQAETTFADFLGGHGGFSEGDPRNGDIDPGRIDNAKLTLDIGSDEVSGVLTFDVKIDGAVRAITLPVVSEGQQQRLRAAVAAKPVNIMCQNRPGRGKEREDCVLTPGHQYLAAEYIDGYGAFFGDHAALAGFHFSMQINVKSRNRDAVLSKGVIILKAMP